MTTIRSLIQSGDLPEVTYELGEKRESDLHRALSHGSDNKFRKVAALFSTVAETDIGLGIHCMYGLVGGAYTGARVTVYAIARIHKIAILDLTKITTRALQALKIQEIVSYILSTPPRCAILVNLCNTTDRLYKVIKRLAGIELKTDHRRVVFCLTKDEATLPTGTRRDYFPGTTDDKISMLLYIVPSAFAEPDRLRIIAEKIRDYTVFEPNLKHLISEGSIDEYIRSLHYQVVKRNGNLPDEDTLDEFPSFEVGWRRNLSIELQKTLVPSPDVTSVAIHGVVPIGVSRIDAIQCFQTALPPGITSPYVLTVNSKATDDKCGSIAITQKTRDIIMQISCTVDPGIMSEVCRELRVGFRSVVQELGRTKLEMEKKMSAQDEEMDKKFSSLHEEMDKKFSSLEELFKAGAVRKQPPEEETQLQLRICKKRTCMKVVTDRFANGDLKKQCTVCIKHSNLKKNG